jgi:hypothetical protein
MNKTRYLRETYKQFCLTEGNQHIASEYAILKLQELVERFNIKSVLEVGLGIGAIAASLLKLNKHLVYTGTEDNTFCLKSLPKNLGINYNKLEIFSRLKSLPHDTRYDLVIIDGRDINIEKVKSVITKHGIIAIEGDRSLQQKTLQDLFPHQVNVHMISTGKNKDYSPFPAENWQGGIKVIFVQPTVRQYIWLVKKKIFTKFKYLYRKRKSRKVS